MSHNYLVHYGYEFPDSELRPEDQKHGLGTIPINTDKAPETEEEFLEIARTIGKQGGYAKVAITKIEETDHFIEDTNEILEGLIVNDK